MMQWSAKRKRFYSARPALERFNERVEKTPGCWIWRAGKASHGYGVFYFTKSRDGVVDSDTAHRAAWRLFKGAIPAELQVLHRCDNRLCVNPDHLFLGTQKDNVQDCVRKGRLVTPRKLSKEQHVQIKARISSGENAAVLASEFNVSRRAIRYIRGLP